MIIYIVNNLINTSTWRKRNKYHSIQIQKFFFWKWTSTMAMALFTLFAYINYVTIYGVIIILFWCYFISSCCKPLKTDQSGEICTCATWGIRFFYQMHTLITDLCLPLLNLKMSIIIISNWGFTWIYKRPHISYNFKNDANINKIILKTPYRGVFNLRCFKWVWRFLTQTSLGALHGLETQLYYKAPSYLPVEIWVNVVINIESVILSPRR